MPSTPAADATATRKITIRCASCGRWNRIDVQRATAGPKCGACGSAIALDHPVTLDDDSFDRVIAGTDLPVLVDFYADWCGPCRMMAPAVDELARTTIGLALIAKLDTDAAQRVASRFQIRGIPTTIVFRNGREARRQTGAAPLATLRALLD
ncbi:MAG TPA: thioredoxin [Gemmatimonadaceae bacterium]|nr:thioredoxin [Gemmatimonadaceae bacterium]